MAFPAAGLAMALAAVLLLSLVFGCASQASPGTGAPGQANFTAADKTGITTADNRTSYDKTQQAIVAAVADGTYFKEVQYAYHSGIETVDFNITVKNDIATSVSVNAPNPNMMSGRIINGEFGDYHFLVIADFSGVNMLVGIIPLINGGNMIAGFMAESTAAHIRQRGFRRQISSFADKMGHFR